MRFNPKHRSPQTPRALKGFGFVGEHLKIGLLQGSYRDSIRVRFDNFGFQVNSHGFIGILNECSIGEFLQTRASQVVQTPALCVRGRGPLSH